jgi:hypothetical protein
MRRHRRHHKHRHRRRHHRPGNGAGHQGRTGGSQAPARPETHPPPAGQQDQQQAAFLTAFGELAKQDPKKAGELLKGLLQMSNIQGLDLSKIDGMTSEQLVGSLQGLMAQDPAAAQSLTRLGMRAFSQPGNPGDVRGALAAPPLAGPPLPVVARPVPEAPPLTFAARPAAATFTVGP